MAAGACPPIEAVKFGKAEQKSLPQAEQVRRGLRNSDSGSIIRSKTKVREDSKYCSAIFSPKGVQMNFILRFVLNSILRLALNLVVRLVLITVLLTLILRLPTQA
jgi:hypothetical protein